MDVAVSFVDYLEAKAALDSRSLHPQTWSALVGRLRALPTLRLLEVGAGTGTMLERLFLAGALGPTRYWALEPQGELLDHAAARLRRLVRDWPETASDVALYPLNRTWQDFLHAFAGPPFDAVVAHAFADLVDAAAFLDEVRKVLRPGGLAYLSLNFSGVTEWFPSHPEDRAWMDRYHADMDGPVFNGRRSGPRSFTDLWNRALGQGWSILSAGPSDWVILDDRQHGDRTVILWLLQTVEGVLGPEAAAWIQERRAQARQGQLGLRVSHGDLLLEKR